MVLIFMYIYIYIIGSRDQLIVQSVLLSKCAELLAYVGCEAACHCEADLERGAFP